MPYHQSSAVSVATVMTAATVIVLGYRLGRAHAAWRDVRATRRDLPAKRRVAWGHTRPLLFGTFFLLVTAAAAAYDASH
jgi:hypothetical protein